MKSFKQFYKEKQPKRDAILEKICLFEYEAFKLIPGTRSSYKQHPTNTNSKTLAHSHVYAKANGKGQELYSVNINGSGHDGSSGVNIPPTHADYFRSLGYRIEPNNLLESIDLGRLSANTYNLIIIENA